MERELELAKGAARIPLLVESARLRREEPAVVLERVDEALALLARFPAAGPEIEARVLRSDARQQQSDYPAAREDAEQALHLAEMHDSGVLLAKACVQLAFVRWRMAAYDDALALAERARTLLVERGPSLDLVRCGTILGAVHQSQDDLGGALQNYLATLEWAEQLGDEVAIARAHNNVGIVYWDLGRFEDAHAALRRALDVFERAGPKSAVAGTLNNLGLVLTELDRPAEAEPYLERALALDEEFGDRYGQAKDLSNLGFVHEKLDELEVAITYHERACALRDEIGDQEGRVRSRLAIAEVRLAMGDAKASVAAVEEALPLATQIGARRDEGDLYAALAGAREALGDPAGALAAHRRFHEIDSALNAEESQGRIAEQEVRYRTQTQRRELEAAAALAASRANELRWLIGASALLGACLVLLAVLFVLRGRAQRDVAESEQRYRALFRSTDVPLFLIDADPLRVLDRNDPARALCGSDACTPQALLEDLEPEWLRTALGRLFASGTGASLALDDHWFEPSGLTRWTELRANRVALGGRGCWLVSVRDTTETRVREEARMREDKLQSLGVFAGGIAHDFNNALASILGHVELAQDGEPAETQEMLERAARSAVEAQRLTSQLLAFAKGGEPVRRVADVGRLLRDAVELAGAGSHLRVELDVPEDLWAASLDAGQFGQVVGNLVINAQQATGEGGRLVVRAANVRGPSATSGESEQCFVRIDFEDDGTGIPEQVRDHVFDPYFTTKAGGSGLGLATAFRICRKHGGTLGFESREGHGTTFHAYFPAVTEGIPAPDGEPVAEPVGRGRVLVLEDEVPVQHVLRHMLERWGFQVEVVADGRAAVQRYGEELQRGRRFDLLIMDLTIPGGVGGRQAFREILSLDPHARAIVESGYSDDPTMAEYREAGFHAALAKPFRRTDLARALNCVLGEHGEEARARARGASSG